MNFQMIVKECVIKASRSSGKGGQHVNKVSTRIELFFHISDSQGLNDAERCLLKKVLASKLSKNGVLHLSEEGSRSQARNKGVLINKLENLLLKSLTKPKKRIPTKTPSGVNAKRLKDKKILSVKKINRKKDF